MGFSISGLGSGFDWQTMVSQLRQVEEQQRLAPLYSRQSKLESQKSAWDSLGSKLSALLTAVGDMKDSSDFDVFKSTLSTNSATEDADSFLSVTAGTGAAKGTYDIKIERLAMSQKLSASSFASKTTTPGWSNFSIEGQSVGLTGSETVEQIRDKINAINTGDNATGVTASILKVSDTDYRLTLTKEETGSAIAFTGNGASYFNQDNPIQDFETAKFSIDGIVYDNVESNSVDDAIPGVTINLAETTGLLTDSTKVTVDLDRDKDAIKTKLKKVVDAYNGIVDFMSQQMSYTEGADGKNTTGGALFGDTMLKSIKSKLASTILDSEISQYGLSFETNGKLSLDTDKLNTSLDSDYSATLTAYTGLGDSLDTVLDSLTDSIDGTITNQKNSLQSNLDSLTDKISNTQMSIENRMALMTTQFISMDTALNQLQSQQSWLASALG